MKKRAIPVALLLILALMLSLAGCGFAGKMTKAAKKMEKLESYRMDLNMDMEMTMAVLGQKMDLDMQVKGSSDVDTKNGRTRSEMRLEMLGEELRLLSYSEKTEDGLVGYSSADGGDTWSKATLESEELKEAAELGSFTDLLRMAESFEETGTETVRGSEATVYAGQIRGEDLKKLAQMSEMLEDVLETMNSSLEELGLEELGDVPVTISLDNKSGMVVRYTVDLTELMRTLMPAMLDAVMEEAASEAGLEGLDLRTLGFTVETGRVFAQGELYDFDAVGEIEIPDEVLAAPEYEAA